MGPTATCQYSDQHNFLEYFTLHENDENFTYIFGFFFSSYYFSEFCFVVCYIIALALVIPVCSLFLILCLSFVRARTNPKKKTKKRKNLRKKEKKNHSTAIFDLRKFTKYLVHLLPTSQDLCFLSWICNFSLLSIPWLVMRFTVFEVGLNFTLCLSFFFSLIFDSIYVIIYDWIVMVWVILKFCSKFDWDSSGSSGLNWVC